MKVHDLKCWPEYFQAITDLSVGQQNRPPANCRGHGSEVISPCRTLRNSLPT